MLTKWFKTWIRHFRQISPCSASEVLLNCYTVAVPRMPLSLPRPVLHAGLLANSKYKIQALFKDFQEPKLHFSSTKIIDKKPYPRRGHSKFRLQCDTEVYCNVLTNTVTCIQVLASKLSTNAKFQNLEVLNSRTFQGFQVLSSTLSVFKHFQGPWSYSSIFKDFSSTLWTRIRIVLSDIKGCIWNVAQGWTIPRSSCCCC